mgnify:CR=1 FL=1
MRFNNYHDAKRGRGSRSSTGQRAASLALLVTVVLATAICSAAEPIGQLRAEDHRTVIAPFLKNHCIDCHGSDTQEAELRLDTLSTDLVGGPDFAIWAKVRTRLIAGEMPPKDEPRPDKKELARVTDWIAAGLIQAEKEPQRTSEPAPPSQGNRVDHDLLFGPHSAGIVTASPAREWRVSPHIYFKFLQDLDPDVSSYYGKPDYQLKGAIKRFVVRYSQPFTAPATGFSDYSGTFTIDKPTAEVLIRNAKELAKSQSEWRVDKDGKPQIDRRTKLFTPRHRTGIPAEFLALMDTGVPPTPETMEAAIRKQFELVVLRQPNEEELSRFRSLMEKNIQDAGQVEGVRGALASIILLRETIFRSEIGKGVVDEHGRRMLGPRELAYAIAYALTDSRPDPDLVAAASEGRLGTRDDVRSQIERLLNDEEIEKLRILRFFQEYFGYTAAISAFKDDKTVREFQNSFGLKKDKFRYKPEVFVHDTNLLIQHILDADKNVFEELLTTNKAFVNFNPQQPERAFSTYAQQSGFEPAYNLTAWPGKNQPVTLPAGQRAGILTQPSWLIYYSFNDRTDPIHRGKWIRERLLGAAMPSVPLSVDATIPDDPEKTVRERLVGTQKEYCWSCHKKMNPLGLTLEMYDPFGRFRTEELGKPLDATGSIDFSGEEKLDGPVKNGVEMIKRLARSPRVRQVFVRHAFRYWMGRAETINDAPTLVAADRAYVESGGSMKALITSLLTSDSFLYRVRVKNKHLARARSN